MSNLGSKQNEFNDAKTSKWAENAAKRIKHKKWLRYSSNIARRILALIEDKKLNQSTLADEIGVSAQYINKVVKGHENLTLETIAKLSDALKVELITFPDYKYSYVESKIISNTSVYSEAITLKPIDFTSEKDFAQKQDQNKKSGFKVYIIKSTGIAKAETISMVA